MNEYALGSEKTFSGAAAITDGDIAAAVSEAGDVAQRHEDQWAQQCPATVASFAWKYGYEVHERPGQGWFAEVTQSIRLYSLEESTTLPGDWGNNKTADN